MSDEQREIYATCDAMRDIIAFLPENRFKHRARRLLGIVQDDMLASVGAADSYPEQAISGTALPPQDRPKPYCL